MTDKRVVLVEGRELTDENIDEKAEEIARLLVGTDEAEDEESDAE